MDETEQEQEQKTEEAQGRELRLEIRIDQEFKEHVEKVANFAAFIGLIPTDHRGNKTAYINLCFNVGEQYVREEAKKRGYL